MRYRHLLILILWICNSVPASAQDSRNLPLVDVLRLNTEPRANDVDIASFRKVVSINAAENCPSVPRLRARGMK